MPTQVIDPARRYSISEAARLIGYRHPSALWSMIHSGHIKLVPTLPVTRQKNHQARRRFDILGSDLRAFLERQHNARLNGVHTIPQEDGSFTSLRLLAKEAGCSACVLLPFVPQEAFERSGRCVILVNLAYKDRIFRAYKERKLFDCTHITLCRLAEHLGVSRQALHQQYQRGLLRNYVVVNKRILFSRTDPFVVALCRKYGKKPLS